MTTDEVNTGGRPPGSFWCWKIACILLYGDLSCIHRIAPGSLHIALGEMARHLRITNHKLRAFLSELQTLGIISDLTFKFGSAIIRINAPIGYKPQGVQDADWSEKNG